jgi:hypothetical protein
MQKRYNDLLCGIVTELRRTLSGGPNGLRGDLDRELERLGVAPDGTITPFDAVPNPSAAEPPGAARGRGASEWANQRGVESARNRVLEGAAHTWINCLLA